MKKFRSQTEITDIVWDADNTLWDWYRFHGKGMQAMAESLSGALNILIEGAEAQLKAAYEEQSLLDYANVIECIPAVREVIKAILDGPFIDEQIMQGYTNWIIDLVTGARDAYSEVRDKEFKLYPGVKQILKAHVDNGGRNYIYTDAPLYKTIERLGRKGIDKYFTMVWGNEDIRTVQTPHALKQRVERYVKSPLVGVVSEHKKPNVDLSDLLNISKKSVRQNVAVVGDSKGKDMWTAHINGCLGFYALYGQPSEVDHKRAMKFASERQQADRKVDVGPEEIERMMQSTRIIILKRLLDIAPYLNT